VPRVGTLAARSPSSPRSVAAIPASQVLALSAPADADPDELAATLEPLFRQLLAA
jgi:hypothetical protein